ncbi:MAG: hypothetical protein NTW19_17325, partial [Planctomycetota bacterium]|nr:hypothetical protein [Planctomycetota bacterium]
SDNVVDAAGSKLDGEWVNPTARTTPAGGSSSFASGNGTAGGNFVYRLNVAPGDANQNNGINVQDVVLVRNRQGSSTASPANYSVFNDINANGGINVQDVVLTRNQQGKSLPSGEPALPAAAMSALVIAGSPPSEALVVSPVAAMPARLVSSRISSAGAFPAPVGESMRAVRGWTLRSVETSGDEDADALHRRRRHMRGPAEGIAASSPLVLRGVVPETPEAMETSESLQTLAVAVA